MIEGWTPKQAIAYLVIMALLALPFICSLTKDWEIWK